MGFSSRRISEMRLALYLLGLHAVKLHSSWQLKMAHFFFLFCHRLAPGMERSASSKQALHLDRSLAMTITILQWPHLFAHLILILFDQFHRSPLASSMIDLQPSRGGPERRPDVAVHQAARDFPLLFQNLYLATSIDLSHKMDSAFGQRQDLWQAINLFLFQWVPINFSICFSDTQPQQRGRLIGSVPGEKLASFSLNLSKRGELIFVPETLAEQMIDPFNQIIPPGFSGRNEDQLNPKVQRKSNKSTENARPFTQPGESRIVVYLQEIGHPDLLPSPQSMLDDCRSAFIAGQCLSHSMGLHVNGVKDEDLLATFDVAQHPIKGMKDQIGSCLDPRIETFGSLRTSRFTNAMSFEQAIDGREARNLFDQTPPLQLSSDGFGTDECYASDGIGE
jgi:hypothetical protein